MPLANPNTFKVNFCSTESHHQSLFFLICALNVDTKYFVQNVDQPRADNRRSPQVWESNPLKRSKGHVFRVGIATFFFFFFFFLTLKTWQDVITREKFDPVFSPKICAASSCVKWVWILECSFGKLRKKTLRFVRGTLTPLLSFYCDKTGSSWTKSYPTTQHVSFILRP